MLPSVLTAKRSAPLQRRWTGCCHRSPHLVPTREAPRPHSEVLPSPKPQPRAASRACGADNGAQAPDAAGRGCPWPGGAPQPWLLSSSPAVSSCVCRLLAAISPHEHAHWAHLPGVGDGTLEAPGADPGHQDSPAELQGAELTWEPRGGDTGGCPRWRGEGLSAAPLPRTCHRCRTRHRQSEHLPTYPTRGVRVEELCAGEGGLLDPEKPTIGTFTPHGQSLTRVQVLPPSLPVHPHH